MDEVNWILDYVIDEEKVGWVDIMDQLLVMIDGVEFKDLDDVVVVWCLLNGNFYLGVYIVDVSYYVIENFELDWEVFKCGMLVYLIDCVILMLLWWLLNGICFLNFDVE